MSDPVVVYDDGWCAGCARDAAREFEERRGYCVVCGHFYDDGGMHILDVTVVCKVHSPIKGSCPHSGSLD